MIMSLTMRTFALATLLLIVHNGIGEATICSARGRFPNNLRTDCRGYTMCLAGVTSLVDYDLTCPEQSVYSHIEQQCTNVTSYQCLQNYTCTDESQLPYELNDNCSLYIACVKDLNNITSARLIECPQNELFSSIENTCVNKTMFDCHPVSEAPKVYQVSMNQFPGHTNNDTMNNAVYANGRHFNIIFCVALLLLK